MTAILTEKSDLTPSATQTANGQTRLTAVGVFDGAALLIETNADDLGWAPVYTFSAPEAVMADFAIGEDWRASLSDIGPKTKVSLSALDV